MLPRIRFVIVAAITVGFAWYVIWGAVGAIQLLRSQITSFPWWIEFYPPYRWRDVLTAFALGAVGAILYIVWAARHSHRRG